jgi:hypothetical protein
MPSSRKPHHDRITSRHCTFLHRITLNTLHSTTTYCFEHTAKGCSMLLRTHCKILQHITFNALWNAAILYSDHTAKHCNMLLWMHCKVLQHPFVQTQSPQEDLPAYYKNTLSQAFPGRSTRFFPSLKFPN